MKTTLIHHFLENSASRFPEKEAVVFGNERISFHELNEKSNQLANSLINSGIQKGDRVTFVLDNSINYIISYFAILKIGGITVAQNTQSSVSYLKEVFSEAGVLAVITQQKYALKVKKAIEGNLSIKNMVLADVSPVFEDWKQIPIDNFDNIFRTQVFELSSPKIIPPDIASIIYTSGSTGKPMGVTLSHQNLVANTESIVDYLRLTSSDRIMVVLPFSYSYGKSLLHTHFKVGASVIINNSFGFPRVVLDQMIEEKCTGFSGVPTNFVMLLEKTDIRDRQFPDLRYVTQAGGAIAPSTTIELKKSLPDHTKIFIMYGQTEASARLSYLSLNDFEDKLGSIGKAIPNVELVIKTKTGKIALVGETGEIVARGENIMTGYWNQLEETAQVLKEDGLHTGDLAKKDEDGFIYIVGRTKEMIKSGANRISAKEIEETLLLHSDIIETAVIGVPDEIMGEAIKAFVIIRESSVLDKKQVILFCRKHLALFKVPKYVEFLSSLPKNSSGKLMKNKLS